MSLIVPDDLEQAARERERAIDAAEEQLADAVGEATRELLSRMQKASRSSLTASSPQLPRMASQLFTYGQVAGWWDTALDQNVMAVVQRIWQNGRSSASDATMSSGSFDSVGDYVSAVKDRLSRTATPTIPDDAFNTVREALVDEMARGSTGRQTAERLAAELRWQGQDVGFWKRRQAEAERQIERMLDAAGPKYTTDDRGRRIENPVRKDMRLNDPTVRQYQRELSDATSHLDKDRSVWQTRAERIARTETTAAYNAGSQNAYTEEGAGAKMWIAIADERTREDHLEAHGQCVPTDAAFTVGGEQLLFPGDPSGMGYQVINCRCTTVAADSCEELTAMAEEVGAPIRREREERGEPEPDHEPVGLEQEASQDETVTYRSVTDPWIDPETGENKWEEADWADVRAAIDQQDLEWRESDAWGPVLPEGSEERRALSLYADTVSYDINNNLRHDARFTEDMAGREITRDQLITGLDNAIASSGAPEPIQVERTVSRDFVETLRGLEPGDSITDQGYVSTTMRPIGASPMEDFQTMQIRVPEGAPCLYVQRSLDGTATHSKEFEVLLARGSKFEVVSQSDGLTVLQWVGVDRD